MISKRAYRALCKFSPDSPRNLAYPLTGVNRSLYYLRYIRPAEPVLGDGLKSGWYLTDEGQLAKENYKVDRSHHRKENIRWAISTLIALAALLHSIFLRD